MNSPPRVGRDKSALASMKTTMRDSWKAHAPQRKCRVLPRPPSPHLTHPGDTTGPHRAYLFGYNPACLHRFGHVLGFSYELVPRLSSRLFRTFPFPGRVLIRLPLGIGSRPRRRCGRVRPARCTDGQRTTTATTMTLMARSHPSPPNRHASMWDLKRRDIRHSVP